MTEIELVELRIRVANLMLVVELLQRKVERMAAPRDSVDVEMILAGRLNTVEREMDTLRNDLSRQVKAQAAELATLRAQMTKLVRELGWQLGPGNPILEDEKLVDPVSIAAQGELPGAVLEDEDLDTEPIRIPACRQCQCPVSHVETLCDMCLAQGD